MEGISELLPEEDIQKLKAVSKRLSIHEKEIVRRSVEAYIQKFSRKWSEGLWWWGHEFERLGTS